MCNKGLNSFQSNKQTHSSDAFIDDVKCGINCNPVGSPRHEVPNEGDSDTARVVVHSVRPNEIPSTPLIHTSIQAHKETVSYVRPP